MLDRLTRKTTHASRTRRSGHPGPLVVSCGKRHPHPEPADGASPRRAAGSRLAEGHPKGLALTQPCAEPRSRKACRPGSFGPASLTTEDGLAPSPLTGRAGGEVDGRWTAPAGNVDVAFHTKRHRAAQAWARLVTCRQRRAAAPRRRREAGCGHAHDAPDGAPARTVDNAARCPQSAPSYTCPQPSTTIRKTPKPKPLPATARFALPRRVAALAGHGMRDESGGEMWFSVGDNTQRRGESGARVRLRRRRARTRRTRSAAHRATASSGSCSAR